MIDAWSGDAALPAQRTAAARPPLEGAERRRLRAAGVVAGALLGASAGWLSAVVAVWALVVGLIAVVRVLLEPFLPAVQPATPLEVLLEPWLLWPLLLSLLAAPAGLAVSAVLLRRWGAGRAIGATVAGAVLAAAAGLAAGAATVALVLAEVGAASFEQFAPTAAGLLGAVAGGLAGAAAWPWLGRLLRPVR